MDPPINTHPPNRGLRIVENNKNTALSLLDGLNNLRKEGLFCDYTIRAGDRALRVHKNVIHSFCPRLADCADETTFDQIDGDTMEIFIEYIYTGALEFYYSNVKEVLLAASFLELRSAVDLCCAYLCNTMDADNCIELILWSKKNSFDRLWRQLISVSSPYFKEIYFKNEYYKLDCEQMQLLAREFKGNGYPEDIMYIFVMRWINASHREECDVENLLSELDISGISPEVLNSHKITNTSSPTITAWAATHPGGTIDCILVSRRLGHFRPRQMNVLSNIDSRVTKIEHLPLIVNDGSYVCHRFCIYHFGGWKKNQVLTDTFVYHPFQRMWVPFVPLQEARAYHRSCVVDEKIYTVGGSDGYKAFSSVEFLDLFTGETGFIKSLPEAKERAGLGVHENTMYVVGGSDRGKNYNSLHRFDEREGVWQELAPAPYRAGATTCAVLGDCIYTTHPDAMQRYDIRANNWTLIFNQFKRYPEEIFCCEDTLFGLFRGHIGKYLPNLGKWQNHRKLKCHLPYLQVSINHSSYN